MTEDSMLLSQPVFFCFRHNRPPSSARRFNGQTFGPRQTGGLCNPALRIFDPLAGLGKLPSPWP